MTRSNCGTWELKRRSALSRGHAGGSQFRVVFPPDGSLLTLGSWDRTIKLWDVATQEVVRTLEGHGGRRRGSRLLLPGRDHPCLRLVGPHTVTLWDPLNGEKIFSFGHSRPILSVSLSAEGATLAAGGRDGKILLWDVSEWVRPRPFALEIVSGDGQAGAPGAALAQPLVVEVRDQYGNLLPGAVVTFTVTAGEGQLSGRFAVEHATTDAKGRAELPLTLGLHPGPNTVGVSLGGRELAVFHAEGVGTAVAELDGDYRTWHLPRAATMRLGKGTMGESDRAVALSADGRCLAVASAIGVWLYEAATWRPLALLPTKWPVHSVSFLLDGTLAAGLEYGEVELWDAETGERVSTLRHADRGRVTVAGSRDGTKLASGSGWGQIIIKLWDVKTRGEVATWEGASDSDSKWKWDIPMAFSPDGTSLVSGGQDGTVRLWEVATQEVFALEGHTGGVSTVAFCPDGRLLASGGDHTVRLWDAATQTEVATLEGHTDGVNSVAFSTPDGGTLASGSSDGTVRLWDVVTREPITTWKHTGSVHSVAFSRDGATLASGSSDGKVLLRDLASRSAASLSGHVGLSSMASSHDGSIVALGLGSSIKLWDAVTQTQIAVLDGGYSVYAMALSPDGALLASLGRWDDPLTLWDVATREQVGTLGDSRWLNTVAFSSPDGSRLATGSSDGKITLWDVATRERTGRLEGDNHVRTVSFSPDGATLASGEGWRDMTVKLWDVGTLEPIATLEGHRYAVSSLAFSPDGSTLASGAEDGIKLWNTRIGIRRGGLVGQHVGSFSPDGRMLFAGSGRNVVLWDFAAGRRITLEEGHAGSVNHVTLSPDPGSLISGSGDGTILVWDVSEWTGSPRPWALEIVSGDGQKGEAGGRLAQPLVVELQDQYGDPVANASVTFLVTAGRGTLSVWTATTEADGRAATTLTLGRQPGTNTVRARVSGLQPVTFTATAEATPDFDGDGVTDLSDFLLFAEHFGGSDPRFDLDGNGSVDFNDFFLFAEHFGQPAQAKLVALARELIGLPDGPQLRQNAPNPFNRGTVILWFQLEPGPVLLEVFALTGQRVAVLHEGPKRAGVHRLRWDGRDERGHLLASGVYVYRLVTSGAVQTRKLTVLR